MSSFDVVFIDDGSTDNTHTVAERLTKKDPRVRYKFKTNGGAASARNTGVRYAKGEWVFLLDADDWMHEDTIKIQLQQAPTECLHRLPSFQWLASAIQLNCWFNVQIRRACTGLSVI